VYIRVIRVRVRPGRVDEMTDRWRTLFVPGLAQVSGFRRAWFAGNRELNTVAVVTLWDDLPRATILGPMIAEFELRVAELFAGPSVIEEYEVLAEAAPE
jgi:hypothetical protein